MFNEMMTRISAWTEGTWLHDVVIYLVYFFMGYGIQFALFILLLVAVVVIF